MSQKVTAAMPTLPELGPNWKIVFAALDPDTGAEVAGVKVSNASLLVRQVTPGGPEALVPDVKPLWLPIPTQG